MHGNIDYAPSPEALEDKKRELELFNPHFEYWIERYLGGESSETEGCNRACVMF